ncbi:MAG: cupin domain-containing protein [Oscillochloris sp.]|nr:cupin domain-containing protein [Oscillochloris sp.]
MTIVGPAQHWIEMLPGVRRRRLAATTQLYQMEVRLDAGAEVPVHKHPHEQISHLLSGRLQFHLGGTIREINPGDTVIIPGNTSHAVVALAESIVIDTFSPPRTDYLAGDGDTTR